MGIADLFRRATGVATVNTAAIRAATSPELAPYTVPGALASPWADTSTLERIVLAELWSTNPDVYPMTRTQAVGIPAVARGRMLVAGDIAGLPLRSLTGATVDATQPSWLYRTNGAQAPWHRMLWTVDDLIFHGTSLWGVVRGADGAILDAARIPWDEWSIDVDGWVLWQDTHVRAEDVVLFTGPHEGILNMNAGRTLRIALDLEETTADRAANPVALTELHATGADDLTADEVEAYLAAWQRARQARRGSVAFTPAGLQVIDHGQAADNGFLIQARNASAIDCLRLIGVPAAMADASNVNSTLTYETLQGRNQEYVDRTLTAYTGAIEARLSQDDVVPHGRRVAFDLSQLTTTTPTPTGAAQDD